MQRCKMTVNVKIARKGTEAYHSHGDDAEPSDLVVAEGLPRAMETFKWSKIVQPLFMVSNSRSCTVFWAKGGG